MQKSRRQRRLFRRAVPVPTDACGRSFSPPPFSPGCGHPCVPKRCARLWSCGRRSSWRRSSVHAFSLLPFSSLHDEVKLPTESRRNRRVLHRVLTGPRVTATITDECKRRAVSDSEYRTQEICRQCCENKARRSSGPTLLPKASCCPQVSSRTPTNDLSFQRSSRS